MHLIDKLQSRKQYTKMDETQLIDNSLNTREQKDTN